MSCDRSWCSVRASSGWFRHSLPRRRFVAVVALALLGDLASAEIVALESLELPGPNMLRSYHVFFIPPSAPGETASTSNVTFEVGLQDTEPAEDLDVLLDVAMVSLDEVVRWGKQGFCGKDGRGIVQVRISAEPYQLVVARWVQRLSMRVESPGAYVLAITNCGSGPAPAINGTVQISSEYGFLPIHEYGKEGFYIKCSILHSCVLLVWSLVVLRWWQQLIPMQKTLWLIGSLAVLESVTWAKFYSHWNEVGSMSGTIYLLGLLCGTTKETLMFLAALTTQAGRPEDGSSSAGIVSGLKVYGGMLLFVAAQGNARIMLFKRAGMALSLSSVIINMAPAFAITSAVFWASFLSLASFVKTSNRLHRDSLADAFVRSQVLLVLAAVGALAVGVAQVCDPTVDASPESQNIWQYHFLMSDVLPHIIFVGVLWSIMYLWRPSLDVQGYSYASDLQIEEENKPIGAVWNDDDLEDSPPAAVEAAAANGDDRPLE